MESVIDFDNSFLSWRIYDHFHGRTSAECLVTKGNEEFVLGKGVLACKVISDAKMIIEPTYLYHPVLSEKNFKIFRHGKSVDTQNDHGKVAARYNSVDVDIKRVAGGRLTNAESVIAAATANKKITASIRLTSGSDYCLLEFPVKHVYFHSVLKRFQMETGPILLPFDLSDISIPGSWNMCYLAFADFERLEYAMIKNTVHGTWQSQEYGPVMELKTQINVYSSL